MNNWPGAEGEAQRGQRLKANGVGLEKDAWLTVQPLAVRHFVFTFRPSPFAMTRLEAAV
jgi:hypothetical protein